jgi:hypothetical protein
VIEDQLAITGRRVMYQDHGPQSEKELTEGHINKLYNDYSYLGISLDDVHHIIAANPYLNEGRLRRLLDRYVDVVKNSPDLVRQYGEMAVFKAFISLSAYDPAHGGNYTERKPGVERDLGKGMEEAVAELGAMETGKIPWPITPSTSTDYEGTDPTGQTWDVKSPLSVTPNGRPFNADDMVEKMQKDFSKGENIILDTRNLTPKEIQQLYERLKARRQDGRVVWWPGDPTIIPYRKKSF